MPETTLTLKANNAELLAKLKQSEAAVESLTAEVEKLEQAGEGGIELEGELGKLKDQAYNAKRALEVTNQELAEHKQKTLEAAKAAEEQKTALGGLFDGLSKVQKVLGAAGLAILAFKESFNKTREAIRFFKENFGIDVDEMVQKVEVFGVSLDSLAERIAGLGSKQKQAALDSEQLRNAINVLDNLGIAHAGTVEDVTAKYDEWAKGHRKVIEATEANNAAFEKFAKNVTGFTVDQLIGELEEIESINKVLAEQGADPNGAFSQAAKERAEKLTAAVATYGTALDKAVGADQAAKLRNFADSFRDTALAQEDAAKAAAALAKAQAPLKDAIERTSEAVEKQIDVLRKVRSEALKNEGDILAQASDIEERIEEALSPDTEGIRALRDEIDRLRDQESELSFAFSETDEVLREREKLLRLIAQKTDELREKEFFAPDTEAMEKAQDDFRKLLDAAQSKLEELPESARGAADAIIERFRAMNSSVGASALDVRDFKLEFSGAMAVARLEAGRLEDQAKVTMDTIAEATKIFHDDMLSLASEVADALRKGPLAALKEIKTELGAMTPLITQMGEAATAAI